MRLERHIGTDDGVFDEPAFGPLEKKTPLMLDDISAFLTRQLAFRLARGGHDGARARREKRIGTAGAPSLGAARPARRSNRRSNPRGAPGPPVGAAPAAPDTTTRQAVELRQDASLQATAGSIPHRRRGRVAGRGRLGPRMGGERNGPSLCQRRAGRGPRPISSRRDRPVAGCRLDSLSRCRTPGAERSETCRITDLVSSTPPGTGYRPDRGRAAPMPAGA